MNDMNRAQAGNAATNSGKSAPYSKRHGPPGGRTRTYWSAIQPKKRRSTSRHTTGYVASSAAVSVVKTW